MERLECLKRREVCWRATSCSILLHFTTSIKTIGTGEIGDRSLLTSHTSRPDSKHVFDPSRLERLRNLNVTNC